MKWLATLKKRVGLKRQRFFQLLKTRRCLTAVAQGCGSGTSRSTANIDVKTQQPYTVLVETNILYFILADLTKSSFTAVNILFLEIYKIPHLICSVKIQSGHLKYGKFPSKKNPIGSKKEMY